MGRLWRQLDYIYDGSAGEAEIDYGFDSSIGAVAYHSLSIGFSGIDNSGSFGDGGWNWSSSYSNSRWPVWVGQYGTAYTSLGGSVTLWWGGRCDLLGVTDGTYMA